MYRLRSRLQGRLGVAVSRTHVKPKPEPETPTFVNYQQGRGIWKVVRRAVLNAAIRPAKACIISASRKTDECATLPHLVSEGNTHRLHAATKSVQ